MMLFFNRTGLERVGVVGPDLDCCWAGLQALYVALPCRKEQERRRPGRGFARGRSDALVSFFLRKKIDCLEGECVAYLSLMGWPGIYSICFSRLDGDKDSLLLDGGFSFLIAVRLIRNN